MLAGVFIFKELLAGDGIELRLAGLALMGLLLSVVRLKWTKKTFKFELSEIVSNLTIEKFEFFEFLSLFFIIFQILNKAFILFESSLCIFIKFWMDFNSFKLFF